MNKEQEQEIESAGCCPGEIQNLLSAMDFVADMAKKPEVHALLNDEYREFVMQLNAIAFLHECETAGGRDEKQH